MKTKPLVFDKDHVVAVFDFGGGTFDLTVVECKKCQNPKMLITDFGDVMGGSDIDKAFMKFINKITGFDKANISEKDRAIIMSGIMCQF